MRIRIQTVDGADVPAYAHEGDAACDLRATGDYCISPGSWEVIPTGVKIALPDGYAALLLPRSGMSTKRGLTLVNSPGLIDSGYRGEICAPLYNVSKYPQYIEKGDRIAQLMIVPFFRADFEQVEELDDTQRGNGGFGSSGVK